MVERGAAAALSGFRFEADPRATGSAAPDDEQKRLEDTLTRAWISVGPVGG